MGSCAKDLSSQKVAPQPSTAQSAGTTPIKAYFLACAAAAAVLFPLLGFGAVFEVSEAREGVVVLEILGGGSIVLPLRHGEIIPSKPILFHWIGAACGALIGSYDEFGLRLPSALAAAACLLAVFGFVRRAAGTVPGALAAAILASTYGFSSLAADGRVDMLLCFLTTAACLAWLDSALTVYQSGLPPERIPGRTYLVVGVLCGLGVLTKGPLGLLYPAMIVACIAVYCWGLTGLRCLARPGWAVALLIALPWYVLATINGRDSFLARQIVFENISRFFGSRGIVPKPAWYYLEHIWSQGAPWSVALAVYAALCAAARLRSGRSKANGLLPEAGRARAVCISMLIWIGATLFFLSLSTGKRRGYLLSVLPPLAIYLSLIIRDRWQRYRAGGDAAGPPVLYHGWPRCTAAGLWLLASVLPLVLLGVIYSPAEELFTCRKCPATLAAIDRLAHALPWRFFVYFFIFIGGSFALWRRGQHRRRPALLMAAVLVFLQLPLLYARFFVAAKGETHTYREFASQVRRLVPEGQELYAVKKRGDESLDGLFFYLKRRVLLASPAEIPLEKGYYLARRHWFERRKDSFRRRVEVIASGGRVIDRFDEQVVLFSLERPADSPLG